MLYTSCSILHAKFRWALWTRQTGLPVLLKLSFVPLWSSDTNFLPSNLSMSLTILYIICFFLQVSIKCNVLLFGKYTLMYMVMPNINVGYWCFHLEKNRVFHLLITMAPCTEIQNTVRKKLCTLSWWTQVLSSC